MRASDHSADGPRARRDSLGSACVAWGLLALGLAALGASVLVPEWRSFLAMRQALVVEEHRMDSLDKAVAAERRHLEAIQTDPAVIVRLAQRELGLDPPGTRSVSMSIPGNVAGRRHSSDRSGLAGDSPNALGNSPAPASAVERVFCDRDTRRVMIVFSVCLLGVSLWLPVRRSVAIAG